MVLNAVFSAFSLLIMTLYFLAALPSMKRQAYRLVPASRRERVTLLSDEVISRIGGFVSGALSVAFIAGLTSYIFLSIVGHAVRAGAGASSSPSSISSRWSARPSPRWWCRCSGSPSR